MIIRDADTIIRIFTSALSLDVTKELRSVGVMYNGRRHADAFERW